MVGGVWGGFLSEQSIVYMEHSVTQLIRASQKVLEVPREDWVISAHMSD